MYYMYSYVYICVLYYIAPAQTVAVTVAEVVVVLSVAAVLVVEVVSFGSNLLLK
jgi:hypothetical protein